MTNTACSDAYESKPLGIATKCYMAWVNGKWVKGCGYDSLSKQEKRIYYHHFEPLEKPE